MRLYNPMVENVLLPLGDRVLGSAFMDKVRLVRKEVALSKPELEEIQKQRLHETLTFAVSRSRHYRSLAIPPSGDPVAWVKRFPILEKETINSNVNDILTQPKGSLIRKTSSGSSGLRTTVYFSQEELDAYRAIQTVFWEWGGYRLGDRIIQTGMQKKRSWVKRFKDVLLRTKYAVAFNPYPGDVKALLLPLKSNTHSFLGYASSLYVYAKIADELGFEGPKMKTAICWGDKLFDHYRTAIHKQFGCRVYETYGASEGFQMAGQKDLDYMYLASPYVYMEILDDAGREVPDGELGHVVVTSLVARVLPMIRYRIGDLAAKLKPEDYPEKRDLHLPLLRRVVGRDTDIVVTPKSSRLIVHTFTGIFERYPEIRQFRIVQNQKASFSVEFIPGEKFSPEILNIVSDDMRGKITDDSISWDFREVAAIPDSPSGKPQIIVNNLPKPTL